MFSQISRSIIPKIALAPESSAEMIKHIFFSLCLQWTVSAPLEVGPRNSCFKNLPGSVHCSARAWNCWVMWWRQNISTYNSPSYFWHYHSASKPDGQSRKDSQVGPRKTSIKALVAHLITGISLAKDCSMFLSPRASAKQNDNCFAEIFCCEKSGWLRK